MGKVINYAYKGVKNPDKQNRFEVVSQFGRYPVFEDAFLNKRNPFKGALSFNYGKPFNFKSLVKRTADKCISRNGNVSSIYKPHKESMYAWGDVRNPKTGIISDDALLFIISPDEKEIVILIIKGQRNLAKQLYQMLYDGFLEEEVKDILSQL